MAPTKMRLRIHRICETTAYVKMRERMRLTALRSLLNFGNALPHDQWTHVYPRYIPHLDSDADLEIILLIWKDFALLFLQAVVPMCQLASKLPARFYIGLSLQNRLSRYTCLILCRTTISAVSVRVRRLPTGI